MEDRMCISCHWLRRLLCIFACAEFNERAREGW